MSGSINTSLLYQKGYDNIANTYNKAAKTTTLIAQSDRISSFDDIYEKDDAKQMLSINTSLQTERQFFINLQTLQSRTENIHIALLDIYKIFEGVYSACSMYTHMPITESADSISQICSSSLQQVRKVFNSKPTGVYLFSGSKLQTPPVNSNISEAKNYSYDLQYEAQLNSNYYDGDDYILVLQVSQYHDLEYGILASDPAFQKCIAGVHLFAEYVENGSTLSSAKEFLFEGLHDIQKLVQRTRNNYAVSNDYLDQAVRVEEMVSANANTIESHYDLDTISLLSKFKNEEMILKTTESVFMQMTDLTILNYL